jgi:hypothetical protein
LEIVRWDDCGARLELRKCPDLGAVFYDLLLIFEENIRKIKE